jgi:hypothetical protein
VRTFTFIVLQPVLVLVILVGLWFGEITSDGVDDESEEGEPEEGQDDNE